SDGESGVDTSTLAITPAGVVTCQAGAASASCAPVTSWSEGVFTNLTATVSDYAGFSSQAKGGLGLDTTPPTLRITSPANGAILTDPATPVSITYSDGASGLTPSTLQVAVSGGAVTLNCAKGSSSATCAPVGGFPNALYTVTVTLPDAVGNVATAAVSFQVG